MNELWLPISHVSSRPSYPLHFTTKLGVDFSDRFDPTEHKIGQKNFFHLRPVKIWPFYYDAIFEGL